ncbi:type II toxin-antitoxin system PemK/MazF family toxin [Azohydromonas sediminis]|uniref:type II toxin-antitoxin system PemK/MazF family toxin n=1 Tax=Azohydromonas sediminis TaxID=2259674 RepID=UPI000E65D6A4|nr:type II toxin-antitoxin system PemK/MazF family toxin [Azohydromonas sediminis]
MQYEFGDVILVPFTFTDRSTTKQRPAVIASGGRYNVQRPDVVLLAITSRIRQPLAFAEALVVDWQAAGLIKPSVLKPLLAPVEQRLIIKVLGKLSVGDVATRRSLIQTIVG